MEDAEWHKKDVFSFSQPLFLTLPIPLPSLSIPSHPILTDRNVEHLDQPLPSQGEMERQPDPRPLW
jgi:hypothetical protein